MFFLFIQIYIDAPLASSSETDTVRFKHGGSVPPSAPVTDTVPSKHGNATPMDSTPPKI